MESEILTKVWDFGDVNAKIDSGEQSILDSEMICSTCYAVRVCTAQSVVCMWHFHGKFDRCHP